MAHIKVLSKEIAELIAAGEVIERPSSVIKELVENSIDAGAKHITVEIKNGGTTYMRVTDDGCGISFEDVPSAFIRHATSKIVTKDDLNNIFTLGFRGEALASVAAVSKVEVMTKQKDDTYGTLYEIAGSCEISHEKSGCPDGTTVIIRDLFYNVPARAKFMKKDVTEANAVSNIVQKITMSHPDIAIKMIRDNRVEFNSAGDGELFSAVYAVYGRDFARDLIAVDHEFEGIHIRGFIVKPLYARTNRTFQNFFVNRRYIRSRLCSTAVESAYENMIMTGKFPAFILLIDMPPSDLDVNIHPAKAEVRFTNEKKVVDALYFAVKNALISSGLIYEFEIKPRSDWDKIVPEEDKSIQSEFMITPIEEIAEAEQAKKEMEREKAAEEKTEQNIAGTVEISSNETNREAYMQTRYEQLKDHSLMNRTLKFDNGSNTLSMTGEQIFRKPYEESAKNDVPEKNPDIQPDEENEGFKYINSGSFEERAENVPVDISKKTESNKIPEIKIIGEAFGLYIIAEAEGKMIMVDKHAAHERIIFERLKSRNCRQYSQVLLTYIKVLLTAEEFDAMENNADLLEDMGFSFDFAEKPFVTAKAVPTFIMEMDMEEIICEVADNLLKHKQNPQTGILDDMLHTMACKAAVKAHDKSSPEEMKSLVEQVFMDENVRHCPHGRPVMFTMTKANIDHQFKRV